MLLTTALLIAGGISAAAGLASSAGNIIAQHINREDEQEFNAQEALLNRQFQSTEAQTARQFQSEEAAKQRDWEKMMSDTSYQRQIEDMKLAGLNPASVGLSSSGASTPVGSSAASVGIPTGSTASSNLGVQNPFNSNYFSNLLSTGMQFAMAKDKSFTNKVIGEMYASNASQMRQVSEAIKTVAKSAGY